MAGNKYIKLAKLIISNNQYSKFNLPFITDIRGQILGLPDKSTVDLHLKQKYIYKSNSLVFLPCQLMKRQLIGQKLVRKLLFLVCCFFSVIWNISKINCFEDKMKIKLPKWVFWETIFELWEHQCLSFLCFHYWDLMTINWRFINCLRTRTLLIRRRFSQNNICFYLGLKKKYMSSIIYWF